MNNQEIFYVDLEKLRVTQEQWKLAITEVREWLWLLSRMPIRGVDPLLVTDNGDGTYQIVNGKHRYFAMIYLEWDQPIPCIKYTEGQSLDEKWVNSQ